MCIYSNMEFLINQSQLELILKEGKNSDDISNSLKRMQSFIINMVDKVFKTYGLNLKMFLTWGTSIAGLVMPLNEFLKSGQFKLTEAERYLILSGIAFVIFYEGRRGLTKILTKIKEQGLGDVFDIALLKAEELRDAFLSFLKSLKIVSTQLLEIVSYAFLIPIIGDIQSIATSTSSVKEGTIMVLERLLSSGLVLVSKEILASIIKKIIKRLQ